MRTLQHLSTDKQQSISRETLDIYAPLAHRLGMGKVRGELEDLAFRYVDAITYEQLHEAIEARRTEGEQFLSGVEALLNEKLRENNVKARVEWRIKRLSAFIRNCKSPAPRSIRSTICWLYASSPPACRTATPSSASSTASGVLFLAASRTSSPCRALISTSRCTPQ